VLVPKNFSKDSIFLKSFLKVQPNEWPNLEGYEKGKSIIHSLKVVNDAAERGVKLMQEYNDKFTTNKDQKQFVLQVKKNTIIYYIVYNKYIHYIYLFILLIFTF